MKDDKQFRTTKLVNVRDESDGWQITDIDGWSFFVEAKRGPKPKIGAMARFYGRGIGSIVRGLEISDHVYYYRTEQEEAERHRQWCEDQKNKRRKRFEENKAGLDAAYNDLPEVFKLRLDRFRSSNPEFRWEFEPYEMSCCVDAVNIATRLKTVEAIEQWRCLPYDERQKRVQTDEGHSGNSYDCAVYLAKMFLAKPENVVVAHGALTPLVGCKEYGCTHPQS